jgi:hypothetical protein
MSDVTSNGNAGDTGSLGPPDLLTNNIDPGVYKKGSKYSNGDSKVRKRSSEKRHSIQCLTFLIQNIVINLFQ